MEELKMDDHDEAEFRASLPSGVSVTRTKVLIDVIAEITMPAVVDNEIKDNTFRLSYGCLAGPDNDKDIAKTINDWVDELKSQTSKDIEAFKAR